MSDLISELKARELSHVIENIVSHLDCTDIEIAMKVSNPWRKIFFEVLDRKWRTQDYHIHSFEDTIHDFGFINGSCHSVVAVSPKWIFKATTSRRSEVQVLNRRSKELEKVLRHNGVMNNSRDFPKPSCAMLATDHKRLVVLHGVEGKISVWNLENLKKTTTLDEYVWERKTSSDYPSLRPKAALLRNELLTCVELSMDSCTFKLRKFKGKTRIKTVAAWNHTFFFSDVMLGFEMSQSYILLHVSRNNENATSELGFVGIIELRSKETFDCVQLVQLDNGLQSISNFSYSHPYISILGRSHFKVWDVRKMEFINLTGLNADRIQLARMIPGTSLIVTCDVVGGIGIWDVRRMIERKCGPYAKANQKRLLSYENVIKSCISEPSSAVYIFDMAADLYGIYLSFGFLDEFGYFYHLKALNVV